MEEKEAQNQVKQSEDLSQDLEIIVVRHAQSYYNSWKKKCFFNVAPFYPNTTRTRDPKLSEKGFSQAASIPQNVTCSLESIDAFYCSPLRRTIQTLLTGFPDLNSQKVKIEPLLRERTNTAGDLGSPKERLIQEFPTLKSQLEALPDYFWLSHCKDWKEGAWRGKKPFKVRMESKKSVKRRTFQFKTKLKAEMEQEGWKRVVLVLHSKLFSALCPGHKKKIKNAEVLIFKGQDFF